MRQSRRNRFCRLFREHDGRIRRIPGGARFYPAPRQPGLSRSSRPDPCPIAIAHVFYPLRANENNGWLLVNGAPPLINVDDRSNLPLGAMRSSPSYQAIHGHYPNVAFWPGDRGAAAPEFSPDGREITIGYWLRDFCHACAIVGHVRFAFDFAASGRFLGARLVSVIPAGQG